MGATLLVSAVGRRRYVVEELLTSAGPDDILLVADDDPYAPGLHVNGAVVVPPRRGRDPIVWVEEILTLHSLDAIASLHDFDLVELSRRADSLLELGVRIIGPSFEAATTLIDKFSMNEFLREVAEELSSDVTLATVGHVDKGTRKVLKDRFGSGSSGLRHIASNQERVEGIREAAKRVVWTPQGMCPGELVLQECFEGEEFNLDLFFAPNGLLAGHCLKRKISMRGGETDAAEVLIGKLDSLVERFSDAFSQLDVIGNVDIDFFYADGKVSVIDVNPRFGGGYAFSAISGYDAAHGVWCLAASLPIEKYLSPSRELRAAKYVAVAQVHDLG